VSSNDGNGSSSGSGGTLGTAGNPAAGSGNPGAGIPACGSATGGACTAATGGSSGCSSTVDCTTYTVTPTSALITDWTDLNPANNGFVQGGSWCAALAAVNDSTITQKWWDDFFGGPFAYPTPPDPCFPTDSGITNYPTGKVENGAYHIFGTLAQYSGFGIWFEKCKVDMSAYGGVQFDIWGNIGVTPATLKFSIFTATNKADTDEPCRPGRGTCTLGSACAYPNMTMTIPATQGTPVVVHWTDLTGGNPDVSPNPKEIWQFQWEWIGATAGTAVDFNLGKITLVP
jgi:hypothetical protein